MADRGGHHVLSCFDMCVNGGNIAAQLWAFSGRLYVIHEVIRRPDCSQTQATLHHVDGSGHGFMGNGTARMLRRPSVTCHDPFLALFFVLPPSDSGFCFLPFKNLAQFLRVSFQCIMHDVGAVKEEDCMCLRCALHGACVSFQRTPLSAVLFWPCHPPRENPL